MMVIMSVYVSWEWMRGKHCRWVISGDVGLLFLSELVFSTLEAGLRQRRETIVTEFGFITSLFDWSKSQTWDGFEYPFGRLLFLTRQKMMKGNRYILNKYNKVKLKPFAIIVDKGWIKAWVGKWEKLWNQLLWLCMGLSPVSVGSAWVWICIINSLLQVWV